MGVRRGGRNIERGIVRAIGKQGQRDQHGQGNGQKSYQLIKTAVFSRSKQANTSLHHSGEGRSAGSTGRAGAIARFPCTGTTPAVRLYQRRCDTQQRS